MAWIDTETYRAEMELNSELYYNSSVVIPQYDEAEPRNPCTQVFIMEQVSHLCFLWIGWFHIVLLESGSCLDANIELFLGFLFSEINYVTTFYMYLYAIIVFVLLLFLK